MHDTVQNSSRIVCPQSLASNVHNRDIVGESEGPLSDTFDMDLNTISEVAKPTRREQLPAFRAGDAFLAGGTWLFSEPQPKLNRLIDLGGLGWQPIVVTAGGVQIASTCTLAQLDHVAQSRDWRASRLIDQCCRALYGSFKIWNVATIGGNICMALPAGPMIALTIALDGICTIWTPDGRDRNLAITDVVIGPETNSLAPGEILRAITVPIEALARRTAFRQISLTPYGRSAALLIGTLARDAAFALTVTAATRRPIKLSFPGIPSARTLRDRIENEIPSADFFDDVHGAPAWRRHMTLQFADEIRHALSASA
jgi:CO/xanthine dehydrogenase FAD-binding subunit